MCGISGVIDSVLMYRLRDHSLHHRGPDGTGVWIAPDSEIPAKFIHNRLAILDLSPSGAQPMVSQDGNYILVFNGEIYNFLELKKDLEKDGVTFRGDSDTEVLLNGLVREGVDFLHKCNGMWAFCLWDRKNCTVLLARDRFGKKPLFYMNLEDGGFAFGSEMKALYPLMDRITPDQDYRHFCDHPFQYEGTEHCLIQGIKRLRPGHYAYWKAGSLQVVRWWNTLDHLVEVPLRYEDQVEQWRELFVDAVRIRMRADVRIGTALSGGIDSTAVFSAMGYIRNKYSYDAHDRSATDWQHGVCAAYPGSSLDETSWATIAAEHVGCKLDKVVLHGEVSEEALLSALYRVEDPYLTLPVPMLETYREISNRGIKVTLDGHGADELLSGYGGELIQFLPHLTFDEFRSVKRAITSMSSGGSDGAGNDIRDLVGWYSARVRAWNLYRHARRWLREAKNFGSRDKTSVTAPDYLGDVMRMEHDHPRYRSMDLLTRSLYDITHLTILPTLLRNYDRYSMASGIEIRMPFLDYRLVCFAMSLPWTSKVRGGFTKSIIRDSLVGVMPDAIRLRRDKIGWNAPLHEWFNGPLNETVNRINSQHGKDDRLLNAAVCDYRSKSKPSFYDGQRLWQAMLPYLWRQSLELKL